MGEGRTGLVEGDVPVLADTAEEELDAAKRLDARFVRVALADEVLGVPVEDVYLRGRDVDCRSMHVSDYGQMRQMRTRTVREELAEHEGVVGLGVVLGEPDVLVHVEGHDMLESVFQVSTHIVNHGHQKHSKG